MTTQIITMYQVKYSCDSHYEVVLYHTRDEAIACAKQVGLSFKIRSVRVLNSEK